MSGEDNTPPSNSGDDAGRGGQRQPQGGQPQGGQPQGGQPQGGQPQGGQPQGGQAPPQGGQAPPQGGQAPPQGGQYGGQPQGYGGPSTMDKITGALGSPAAKGYFVLTALVTLTIGIASIIVMSLTSFLNGGSVAGPLVMTSLGAGAAGGGGGFVVSLGLGGDTVLVMTLAAAAGVFFAKMLDEDLTTTVVVAGICSLIGAVLLGTLVGLGIVFNLPSGTNSPEAADAIVGALVLGIGALIAGAGGALVTEKFDPTQRSQPASGYQGAPGGQPPQGGQGPR